MKHFMEIAGRRMAYLDEGQGPVLLFGHSYLWDSAMWATQVEALKGSYRCIVPELWGHGDSDVLPDGGCTLATLARDHLALLDALDIERRQLLRDTIALIADTEVGILTVHKGRRDLVDAVLALDHEATRAKKKPTTPPA